MFIDGVGTWAVTDWRADEIRASTSTKSATHPSVYPSTPGHDRLYNVDDVLVGPLPLGMNEPSASRRIAAGADPITPTTN